MKYRHHFDRLDVVTSEAADNLHVLLLLLLPVVVGKRKKCIFNSRIVVFLRSLATYWHTASEISDDSTCCQT